MNKAQAKQLAHRIRPRSFSEYWAFFGGEESGVDKEQGSIIWDYAVKSVKVPEKCEWRYEKNTGLNIT